MVASASLQRLLLAATAVAVTAQSGAVNNTPKPLFATDMMDYLQCQVCKTPELTGSVQDSACDYETVDKAVNEHFHPLLHELSRLTFFRYFKVDLGKECPYLPWQDDGMCASIDCAVCECPSHEIPAPWSQLDQQERLSEIQEQTGKPCDEQTGESTLSKVERKNAVAGESFNEWEEFPNANVWATQGEAEETMTYINLLENPERYTGYSGVQAERIWKAIYEENCFTPPEESALDGMCLEERVYYRLISGLQSSINTHIALTYKFGDKWGVNPSLFVERVGKHRERLQNLYFAYLFVMRAVSKYRHELLTYDYNTGNAVDDLRVKEILRQLLLERSDDARASEVSCPAYAECSSVLSGFDESALFRVQADGLTLDQLAQAKQEKEQLEVQFREKFQNVSRIMDCVTCEKCRLWGKLQTMGLGTAIKILLAEDVSAIPKLHRNELIALINVANNLSRSVDGVKMMRELEFIEAVRQFDQAYKIPDLASTAAMHILKEKGINGGTSTGVNFITSLSIGATQKDRATDGRLQVVTILSDSGTLYESSYYNETWIEEKFKEHGGKPVFDCWKQVIKNSIEKGGDPLEVGVKSCKKENVKTIRARRSALA